MTREKLWAFVKRHAFIIVVSTVFLVASFSFLPWFQYIVNPDATSYFSIAREYASGNVRGAINGYWGPLFSLLLVPAAWAGVDLIIAAKVLITVLCTLIIVSTYVFLIKRTVPTKIAGLAAAILAVVLLMSATYDAITPDILFTLVLLITVTVLLNFLKTPTRKNILLLGLMGALMYLTKGFGLFLFIGVVGIIGVYKAYLGRKTFIKTIRPYLYVAVVFALLVTPFITLISIKNSHFTINTAGEFNHRLMGPVQGNVYPNGYVGPLVPHNQLAISNWETPDDMTATMPKWGILESKDNLTFFINSIFLKNFQVTLTALASFGPLIIVGLYCLAIGSFAKRKELRSEHRVLALTSALMLVGYMLVYSEARYIVAVAVFGIIAATFTISRLWKSGAIRYRYIILVAILSCLPLFVSLNQNFTLKKDEGKSYQTAALQLSKTLPAQSNTIANEFDSYKMCYFAHFRCYGVMTLTGKDQEAYAKYLKDAGVVYYLENSMLPKDKDREIFVQRYFSEVARSTGDLTVVAYKLK